MGKPFQFSLFSFEGTPSGTCIETFTLNRNTFSYGGTLVTSVTTSDGCAQVCRRESACSGYDFNRLSTLCYWHTSTTLPDSGSNSDVDQYIKQRCPDATTSKSSRCNPSARKDAPRGELYLQGICMRALSFSEFLPYFFRPNVFLN